MRMHKLSIAVVAVVLAVVANEAKAEDNALITKYKWKFIDYDWESDAQRKEYLDSKNHTRVIPIDVDRSFDGRTFVTVVSDDVFPATLNTVSDKKGDSGPLLKPYPDWSYYKNKGDCDSIINVFRIAIDRCNRLWVLDSGAADLKSKAHVCPAKLLVFDLYSDKLLDKIVIPPKVAQDSFGKGVLVNLVVETSGERCEYVSVYMADSTGNGMAVFNGEATYRLTGKAFEADPAHKKIQVGDDESFESEGGLHAMALSPPTADGQRLLFFKPLASRSIYDTWTQILRNKRESDESILAELKAGEEYTQVKDVFPSPVVAATFSDTGVMFYGLAKEAAVGCYNVANTLEPGNLKTVARDAERLQYPGGMKIVRNAKGEEELLVLSNRYQKAKAKSYKFDEINFRILSAPVGAFAKDCAAQKKTEL